MAETKTNQSSSAENGSIIDNPQQPQQQKQQKVSATVNVEAPKHVFNDNDEKYLCCCGCHVKCGAKAIAIFEFFVVMICVIYAASSIVSQTEEYYYFVPFGILTIIMVFSLGLALCLKKDGLFAIYFTAIVLRLLLSLVYTIFVIMAISGQKSGNYYFKKNPTLSIAIYIGEFLLELGLTVWFITVVRLCMNYFRDLNGYWKRVSIVYHN